MDDVAKMNALDYGVLTGTVKIKKLRPDAIVPKYESELAAGFDLSVIESGRIEPGEILKVGTGLAVEIPKCAELQIRPRSGLAYKNGITLVNSPGTLDADFRGEICLLLINLGKKPFEFRKGDRLAQGVLGTYIQADFRLVEDLSDTIRGEGGYGHTGIST